MCNFWRGALGQYCSMGCQFTNINAVKYTCVEEKVKNTFYFLKMCWWPPVQWSMRLKLQLISSCAILDGTWDNAYSNKKQMQIQIQEEYKYKYKKIQIKHEHLIYNLQVVAHQQLRYLRWARGNQYNTNITKNCESCSSQITSKCYYKKRDKQGGHRICIHDCICNLYLYLYCLLPLFGSSLSAETNFPLQQLWGQSLQEEYSYELSFPTWQCLWRVHTDKFINRFWQIHVTT